MGELDRVGGDRQNARSDGFVDRAFEPLGNGEPAHGVDPAVVEGGDQLEQRPHPVGERGDAVLHQLGESVGHRQRLIGARQRAVALERPSELERVERVAAGLGVDAAENRPGKRGAEAGVQ